MENSPHTTSIRSSVLLLFAIIITICYGNTFSAPWQFDDKPNILDNYTIQIKTLQPDTLKQALLAKPYYPGQIERPLAYLSFALNWYVGQDNPFGYHLVNLCIHILTAFFLFATTRLLLQTPRMRHLAERDVLAIALLSATLWAINPVQTQAVTYIVQRMASMAALFYVLAVHSYLLARRTNAPWQRWGHLFCCALFFLLALGNKENAVTLLPGLLLIELIFLKRNDGFAKLLLRLLVAANLLLLLAATYYSISHGLLQSLTSPVGSRPFSVGERLLTQPSILLFYLSLLLYPSPARLSIDHSFPLSASLFQPWTTLPTILCVVGLIGLGLWQARKRPLLSLAILFYFINHVVESTIIPLELIFEHRNYLPSFFLFLPIAAGLQWALNRSVESSRLVYGTLVVLVPALLITIGLGTYSRNQVWATEESLWTDALNKAPDNARPYAKLGEIYGWQKEKNAQNLQTAVALLHKAMERESPRTSFKPAIMGNIGKVYANYGLLDDAIHYYHQSLTLNPDFLTSRFDLANALTLQGKAGEALVQIDQVIAQNDQQSRFFNLRALLLLWLDRPEEAAVAGSEAMHRTLVNKERYFYNSGVALGRAGNFQQGQWFLQHALKAFPNDRRILYSLIENRLLAGESGPAGDYATRLVTGHSLAAIQADLAILPTDYAGAPINAALIEPTILDAARQITTALETTVKTVQ
ncbi:MAG: tetratricopeptide repeat protein [Desulfobulbus oligotrophicus]|nr:tetratricopeptide repeat protein [Desulfobulbus oligotrophicus]